MHVGKTAGTSAIKFFAQSGVAFFGVHQHPATVGNCLQRSARRKLIISIRDPVERDTSAFNYRHLRANHSVSHELYSWKWPVEHELYGCFWTFERFARAAVDPNSTSVQCARAAERALDPGLERPKRHQHPDHFHLGKGFEFYLRGVLDYLGGYDVYVVRQEQLEHDLLGVLSWLGGTPLLPKRPRKPPRLPHSRGKYPGHGEVIEDPALATAYAQERAAEYEVVARVLCASVNVRTDAAAALPTTYGRLRITSCSAMPPQTTLLAQPASAGSSESSA